MRSSKWSDIGRQKVMSDWAGTSYLRVRPYPSCTVNFSWWLCKNAYLYWWERLGISLKAWGGEGEDHDAREVVGTLPLQFGAYLAFSNPLGGQLVPGVPKWKQRKLDLINGGLSPLKYTLLLNKYEGCLFSLYFTYFNHTQKLKPFDSFLPCNAT